MTATHSVGAGRRNAVVAGCCGLAVLLVVALAVLTGSGTAELPRGSAAVASVEPWPLPRSSDPDPAPPSPAPPVPTAPATTPVPLVADPTAPPEPAPPAGAPAAPEPSPPGPATGSVAGSSAGSATPPPAWLGSRALAPAGAGPVAPQDTPPELLDRRIVTRDLLPPPTAEAFDPVVAAVPADVLARSTWQPGCPVGAEELRYLLVPHWGFDRRLHTGEVLVHVDAVEAVVAIFAAMHEERFPLEEVRVISAAELGAAPTGDGNVTSAFVCRPAVGTTRWSQHAYGRALDVNPFHNPYDTGPGPDRLVLPELATAYTDRGRTLPGMLDDGSAAVRAAKDAGWGWGGDYRTLSDWMHLSADGS